MSSRVLIVEDEPLIAMVLDIILEDAGYHVVGIAREMHHALRLATEHPIDIAIMDVHLAGGTSGIETAKRLRQEFDVPSLFVSAELSVRTRAMALEWKPIGFVEKPYVAVQIVNALKATAQASVSLSKPFSR